ncbi:MAG TPA: DUF4129 domain-containing protein [Pseudomonadales bacterium]|nr:DUF4129 domain-containing protein [Pseudomonadales bacterium]
MKLTRRRQGKEAFDLIEEAVHLVRTAPPATLAVYYLGAMPFILGLMFFWADMSRNPFANGHLADASLIMSFLFFWMKFWQAVFLRRIRAQVTAQPPPRLYFRRAVRVLLAQMILQPLGFLFIPLSAIPILPFAWVYAFYQNVTALSDGEEGMMGLFKKSCRQAALWPGQNMIALLILAAFGFYVLLNWVTVCLTLPGLCKVLFGIETNFTKSPESLLNSTFFAAMFGLTYLCVDPILKAFYALRCFYGESLESGEDLKAELKQFVVLPKAIAVILVLLICLFSVPAVADSVANQKIPAQVSSADLDHAINQTIHERKYTWRMPREKIQTADENESAVARFFDKIQEMLRKWARAAAEWIDELLKKLFGNKQPRPYDTSSGTGWITGVHLLLWSLVAVVVCALVVFLYRIWINRQKSLLTVVTEPIVPLPNIADENVGADQLPEEGWTKLARELLARGEFRLAMRAFYLASLSHLAARNLISIARFKSNRDYERELRRRGHSFPELLSTFAQNISIFEGVWYGMHEVSPESVNQFALNVERIRTGG